jgi:hypothetical protein
MITEQWFQEGSFKAFKRPTRDPFEVAENDGTLDTLEGEVSYHRGFYILTGPRGEKYPMPPSTFRELKVDNGDGTCSPIKIIKSAKEANHSGTVNTSWGETLQYNSSVDIIVRHGEGKYGVVKKEIFEETYEVLNE